MPNRIIKIFLPVIFLFFFFFTSAQLKIGGTDTAKVGNAPLKIGGDTNKPIVVAPKVTADSNKLNLLVPKEYELAEEPKVIGAQHMDVAVLLLISGLTKGDKIEIPGTKITDAIKNIWKQGLFEDVQVYAEKIEGKKIYITISVVEKPRLSKFTFIGLKKGEANKLRDEVKLVRGKVVTDFLLADIRQTIIKHYRDDGYNNIKLDITEEVDTTFSNSVILYIKVDRGERIRIEDIMFHGNLALTSGQLRRTMKDTKRKRWYSIFHSSKLIADDYASDKDKIIQKYNDIGYRDAKIVKDTVYKSEVPNRLSIEITLDEGHRYYFGNITWVGNSKYSSQMLGNVLGIHKGDIYNASLMNQRLTMNPNGTDVQSLYMDNGYLFFQVNPVEINVHNDTIDLEMRIYEGTQARVNNVTVTGNDKTSDKVIMRQLRTLPGELFRRSDVIRTQRELGQLGYFDPEKMTVNPVPHPEDGTVDINYGVVEKSSDQIELSGGWGGGLGFVGTAGITLKNFSAANIFHKDAWTPIPTGDGEELSLRFQSNGLPYQSVNLTFVEPWVGGHKPNSLSTTIFTTTESNGEPASSDARESINIKGISVGYGIPLKFPDDYCTLYQYINYQYYTVDNYGSEFIFANGYANSISYKLQFTRNSADPNIYPTYGSNIKLSGEWTPPWSYIKHADVLDEAPEQKYNLLEFQKYKFTGAWYTNVTNWANKESEGKLAHNVVLYAYCGFGLMNYYNPELGYCPFNRFYMGGSGLTGYSLIDGREIIAMRGYDDGSLSPATGAVSVVKYTLELRYPISLNASATVYMLAFCDAGNSWGSIQQFNPFSVYRAAGPGVRIFLPMFGLLGFDYGWRFDDVPSDLSMARSQFIFTIGANLGEL
jgi:outer membrane protein insertion porin family